MHLHTIMKSGTSFLPCGNVEAHQTRNVQSPVCPTVKCNVKEEKNTRASQPHGLALLDPHKQKEEKEKKREKTLSPQEKPEKETSMPDLKKPSSPTKRNNSRPAS